MSGPVTTSDADAEPRSDHPEVCQVEVLEGRAAQVGAFGVNRVLPRRHRRSVGAWCFADLLGPGSVGPERGLDVGPHPHIGLQTVTWLLAGQVLHRDSLGSEQMIRAGQLNLMTAGSGVSHSEETGGLYEGDLHGIQLWVALPDVTRHGSAAFEHHDQLPNVELENCDATVIIGELAGTASPARRDTDHLGADLAMRPGRSAVPLAADHEHAVTVLEGAVSVDGTRLTPGRLGYLGIGRDELVLETTEPARVMLLGGEPFPDELIMWWNYVARSRDEVTEAHRAWMAGDGRFGSVASPLDRMVAADPPWVG